MKSYAGNHQGPEADLNICITPCHEVHQLCNAFPPTEQPRTWVKYISTSRGVFSLTSTKGSCHVWPRKAGGWRGEEEVPGAEGSPGERKVRSAAANNEASRGRRRKASPCCSPRGTAPRPRPEPGVGGQLPSPKPPRHTLSWPPATHRTYWRPLARARRPAHSLRSQSQDAHLERSSGRAAGGPRAPLARLCRGRSSGRAAGGPRAPLARLRQDGRCCAGPCRPHRAGALRAAGRRPHGRVSVRQKKNIKHLSLGGDPVPKLRHSPFLNVCLPEEMPVARPQDSIPYHTETFSIPTVSCCSEWQHTSPKSCAPSCASDPAVGRSRLGQQAHSTLKS
ncbi:uncharacterized protein LOC100686948 isoform X1 [Canis lupus familiaris]|uniref:uncharacterized protein LOC100686948 isoform X1 n=1 Tax=Canis lupus familiaris TaxID=9615 RepID=UPI0015F15D59|nr:uncharacterized protein LOC100686948 isoform X1 [Canis lupus familiaris]XP_038318437.1 uncharacterized protein LOC100686948 isoform X1 [Canis lupus familiaris]